MWNGYVQEGMFRGTSRLWMTLREVRIGVCEIGNAAAKRANEDQSKIRILSLEEILSEVHYEKEGGPEVLDLSLMVRLRWVSQISKSTLPTHLNLNLRLVSSAGVPKVPQFILRAWVYRF